MRTKRRYNGKIETRRRNTKGFSLVELLLVLVILATLAAIVIPKFAGRSEQARITAAKTQIGAFKTALESFEVDNGFYPEGENGLIDLVEQPDSAGNWQGPYLEEVPTDPWGNLYIYECPGSHNQKGYDIMSMGRDGRVGGEDDIMNWKE